MVGERIAHYRVEAEIGRGGMGVVYRAWDERLERPVALKLLADVAASQEERRQRVLAEARAASALNHPGILTIYDVGEEGSTIFIAMELVQGQSLRSVLEPGPLDPRSVCRIGAQVAEALAAAHAQGVVHGDVKPENVVVQPEGRAKLLDFGIARRAVEDLASATRETLPTAPLPDRRAAGTLAYMAPEVLRGAPIDARADLYSLGVMIYEMCAGRRPFTATSAAALAAQVLDQEPPRLDSVSTTAPASLVGLCTRLLTRDPALRPGTARDLHIELMHAGHELQLGALLPTAVAGRRAVAVLPFRLLTPNPDDEYLRVSLADALIGALGAGGKVLVRPTSTVARYAGQTVDPLLAARELNVQVLVDGSIQKVGPRLRVQVQAWDAGDGSTLHAMKHDGEMADLFALQDRIAEALSAALGLGAGRAAAPRAPSRSVEAAAHELYLRAADKLSRLNRWDVRTAIEMLESATRIDARFAEAWARLAEAYVMMGSILDPNMRWLQKAERAIEKALRLDRDNAEAHCSHGRVLWTAAKGYQNRPALAALARSLELDPGYHPARLWLCLIFVHVGLLEEAKRGLVEVLATNLDDAFSLVFMGQTLFYLRDFDGASEYYARALQMDQANIWANLFLPTVPLYAGQLDRAEQQIRSALQMAPGEPTVVAAEGLLWALRGEKRRAEQTLARALRGADRPVLHTHHMLHNAAAAYAFLGRASRAVALLDKAARIGLPNYPVFRDDPHFASLADDAGYRRLMRRLSSEWERYRLDFGGLRR